MLRVLVLLPLFAGLATPASAFTTEVMDTPWVLTGVSKDQRTLHVVYLGGGCWRGDGTAVVDTSDPKAVRITVRQTGVIDAPCPADIAHVPLDVPLGARLDGRRVRVGPRFEGRSRPETMPRVVGLRRADAVAALAAQGIRARVHGRRAGVVKVQSPRPGHAVTSRRTHLLSGPFDPRARLTVDPVAGQTVESVLRHGLRFRYRVDPRAEVAIEGLLDCNGQDGGNDGRPTKLATGRFGVPVMSIQLKRQMRRRAKTTCRLIVLSYPRDFRDVQDYLVRRRATVILRHR